MEAPKFKSPESRLAEAQGFGQPDDTLTEIQLRQITDEDIAAANDEPILPVRSSLEFPPLNEEMIDDAALPVNNLSNQSPLVEDNYTPKVVRKNVPEDPKKIAKILAGTNLEVSPESPVNTNPSVTIEAADPTAPTDSQLSTVSELFQGKRPENISRVQPSEGPLGDLTRHGEIPGRIDTATVVPPEKVTFPTDRTPAEAYLNSEKPIWQRDGKGYGEQVPAANSSSFLGRMKKWFGG